MAQDARVAAVFALPPEIRKGVVAVLAAGTAAELMGMALAIRVAAVGQLPADMRKAVFAEMIAADVAEVYSTKANELMAMELDAQVKAMCELPVDIRHAVYAELPAEAVAQLDFTPHILESFHDLMAPHGGCIVPDTALRAISLDQLERIIEHVKRRLGSGEVLP